VELKGKQVASGSWHAEKVSDAVNAVNAVESICARNGILRYSIVCITTACIHGCVEQQTSSSSLEQLPFVCSETPFALKI
jgi:hypothetical protein